MHASRLFGNRLQLSIALAAAMVGVVAWVQGVQAQSPAQIGTNAPLPVFVTNLPTALMLPEGFTPGSHWRYTTWTTPSVISWTATVNRTSGAWANLTITGEGTNTTRWYYVPAMPGSWERQ